MGQTPREEIFAVLDELFGPTRTRQEGRRRGIATNDLLAAAATPEEVRTTYHYCQRRFTTFTEMALLGHLSAAVRESERGTTKLDGFLDGLLGQRETP
jgi:hypothetical protein